MSLSAGDGTLFGPRIRPAQAVRDPLSPVALRIRDASKQQWGTGRLVHIVGKSPDIVALLERLEKVAPFNEPVLILGESGTGKEALAQSLYLLGNRTSRAYVPVNCPQYQEGNMTVSDLFGHKKGSFTGATTDREGVFDTADGGVVFLDEIGDLHMSAQVMLLRSLASGEFQPLGDNKTHSVDVRVVAATNRSLNQLAENQQFRKDLIFRLRYFQLRVPPLRDRGDDWLLILDHFLNDLLIRYGVRKAFSEQSIRLLSDYGWPGNVRELQTVATMGYAMASGDLIEPTDFAAQLEEASPPTTAKGPSGRRADPVTELYQQLDDGCCFWESVQAPFLDRDLNRSEVTQLVAWGLRDTSGSYRDLAERWNVNRYQKFMDFLRHHRLKPTSRNPSNG